MRIAPSEATYRTDPCGSMLLLSGGLVYCANPELWGFALWGTPSPEEVRRLVDLVALDLAEGVAPHASLVDLRFLDALDPVALAPLAAHARHGHPRAVECVRRLALVRPHGIFGMTVAGFFEVIRVAYPVAVFPDLRAATSWLGANELAEILDTRVRDAMEAGPVARALRSWLDVHLAEASLEACAHALAQSPRSLQRHLQLIGRTFRGELQAARVRAAKRLLLDSRENLTTIAFEVGCASLQHLSQLFRRHEGRSPSSWRQEARARHR